MIVTPEQVVKSAQQSLLSYCTALNQNYECPKHIKRIARVLQQIERGELRRVIITIPPRHGKSMLVSQYFPAWWLGKHPDKYLIAASYGQDLADDFGRKVRDQFIEPLYSTIFPGVMLKDGSRSASRFAVHGGGEYFAVGAGAAITGRGAHGLLIDDPIKSREEAESPTMTRRLIDWYESTAYSRLMPGGWIAVICQRWNDQDLVGHLLRNHSHEDWTVINMPAINDAGEALWPEQYSFEALCKISEAVGPYNWASQYQQQPVMRDTAILDVRKITGYDTLPAIKMVLTACDPAISKSTKACNTAFTTLGVGEDGYIYDLETIANRWSFLETLDEMKGIISRHKPHYLGVENVAYQAALYEAAAAAFTVHGELEVIDLKADKDKFRRAASISHIIDRGLFKTNNRALLAEIAAFDPMIVGEQKKDRVDALVHALHMVQMYAPVIERKEPVKKETSHEWFYRMSAQQERESEEQITTNNFDPAYGGPSNPDFY